MTASNDRDECPRCATATVRTGSDPPWCPSCEWNLQWYSPRRRLSGWQRLDRWLFHVAYRLTAGQFAVLAERPPGRRPRARARVGTAAAAVLLLAAGLAAGVTGVWLLVSGFGVRTVFGVLLLVVAWALRPRINRLAPLTADHCWLERRSARSLFALVDRVSAAAGVPGPQILLLGDRFDAFTTTVGLRRHRVLALGAPLWAALGPQERVALLGHELGHFVNGDVRRAPLTALAESTLGRMAGAFDGHRAAGEHGRLAGAAARLVGGVLSRVAFALHLLLVAASARDSQRAEYLADELAAQVAGSAAAVRLFDYLLLDDAIAAVMRREARAGRGVRAWRAAAELTYAGQEPLRRVHRQGSMRTEVSIFAAHPPLGLRARMLESRPLRPAGVVLTEAESDRIDDELAAHYERVRRELAYEGRPAQGG